MQNNSCTDSYEKVDTAVCLFCHVRNSLVKGRIGGDGRIFDHRFNLLFGYRGRVCSNRSRDSLQSGTVFFSDEQKTAEAQHKQAGNRKKESIIRSVARVNVNAHIRLNCRCFFVCQYCIAFRPCSLA